MRTFRLNITILALLFAVAICNAQEYIDTRTQIFEPTMRTLKVSNPADFYAPPIIKLGTDDILVFSFDEITDQASYLRYRLIHCNADWQPSNLLESEYIESFNQGDIDDFAYSSNTFVRYVNYRLELPNEQVNPIASGNYLLQVFDELDPDTVLLQARFMVEEPYIGLSGDYTSRTDRGTNDKWQQISFAAEMGAYNVRDPFQDLIVTAEQVGRPETRRIISHPLRVQGSQVVYEHLPDLIFPAANEFLRFETVRTTYPGIGVDSTRYGGSNYHAWLKVDQPRRNASYLYDNTQQGRFLIREYSATDSDLGADYVTVHFTLDMPELLDSDVYIDGEMTHGIFDRSNRMSYNTSKQRYEAQIPLKQGSYNYRYVAVPRNAGAAPDGSKIDGDKYETINEYMVLIYHRPIGSRGDKLVGHKIITG